MVASLISIDAIRESVGNPYLVVVLLTLTPALELRAGIPVGIALLGRGQWPIVFALSVVTNIILGPIVYLLLDRFLHLVLKIGVFQRFWDRKIVKVQNKIHAKVERYGVVGLGLFIGVPLPGSGVYSGAVGGYGMGMGQRDFFKATVLGVMIAGALVLAVSLVGDAGVRHLILKQG